MIAFRRALAILLVIGVALLIGFAAFPKKYFLIKNLDNNKYYLESGIFDSSPGGIFEGTLENIALTNNYLYAEVIRLSSGDISGIYRMELRSGKVEGPILEPEGLQWSHPSLSKTILP
jgi:hypothetical protein